MYESLPQTREQASGHRASLLTQICGDPRLFSPERQLLNWLLIFTSGNALVFAVEKTIVGIPFVAPLLVAGMIYLALYYLARFKRASLMLLGNVALTLNGVNLTFAWFAINGIDGSTLFFHISKVVTVMTVFKGWLRLAALVADLRLQAANHDPDLGRGPDQSRFVSYSTLNRFIELTTSGPISTTWIRISAKVIIANLNRYSLKYTKCSIIPPEAARNPITKITVPNNKLPVHAPISTNCLWKGNKTSAKSKPRNAWAGRIHACKTGSCGSRK
jgi:hypothetical protein